MIKKTEQAFVSIVLHAHLPSVRHPEMERCLEEVWFFEALTDCYLPLLEMLERLRVDEVKACLNFSISPPLLQMFADEMMQERYLQHMERLIALAKQECERLVDEPVLLPLAQSYVARFEELRVRYRDDYACDVIGAFSRLAKAGVVSLMTSAATHAFLPLYQHQPEMVSAQIKAGVATFERLFGMPVRSMWVPECGYFPGLDAILSDAGVREIVVDTHALTGAQPPLHQQSFAPVQTPNGVTAFARDPESSRQVWSSREGYPGDFDYREYYSDIGFSLPLENLQGYLLPDGTRIPTGIKYLRVSGGNREKEPYNFEQARRKTVQHARHFVKSRLQRAAAGPFGDLPVLMVAPYDAELFGHWWYEGPLWLEAVLRELATEPKLTCISLAQYADDAKASISVAAPAASSWGQAGYNQYWLNDDTSWIYPQVHEAGSRLLDLIKQKQSACDDALYERALKQIARTLLLAQASDWPFIIRAGTTTDYAIRRIQEALARFRYLEDAVRSQSIDPSMLAALEVVDDLFPDLDLEWFNDTSKGGFD